MDEEKYDRSYLFKGGASTSRLFADTGHSISWWPVCLTYRVDLKHDIEKSIL